VSAEGSKCYKLIVRHMVFKLNRRPTVEGDKQLSIHLSTEVKLSYSVNCSVTADTIAAGVKVVSVHFSGSFKVVLLRTQHLERP